MKYYVLLIYPAILLFAVFYKAEISGKGRMNTKYLSLEQSGMIQAAAAAAIMLHHLTQQVTGYGAAPKGPITVLDYMGILFTALFFFFSGYGLITSLCSRPGYLDRFLTKRLPKVLIPFWTINLIGIFLNIGIGHIRYSPGQILRDLFGITLVNSNGWFIIEIVLLYLVFFILFKLIKNRDIALLCMSIAVILLIIYCSTRGHDPAGAKAHWFRGEWWYNSTITFIFGMLYARFKSSADRICRRFYSVLLAVTAALTVVMICVCIFTVNIYGYYSINTSMHARRDVMITLISQMAACLVFTTLILLLNMRIAIGNRILRGLSGIRLELLLLHGYFVNRIFGSIRMGDFQRFAVVILCSIAGSTLIAPVIHRLVNLALELLNTPRTYNDTLEGIIAKKKAQRRKTIIIRTCIVLVIAAAAGLLFRIALTPVFLKREYKSEKEALQTAEIGDERYWGRCETNYRRPGKERLAWIVIRKEKDRVCLLSKYGLAGSSYNQKHTPVSWRESGLYALLQSAEFTDCFSTFEQADMISEDEEMITLLTVSEAQEAFAEDRDRELAITSVAELNGTNINRLSKANRWDMKGYRSSWWWLKGEDGRKSVMAPVVTADGTIAENGKEVNRPGGAIRPVIWVRL